MPQLQQQTYNAVETSTVCKFTCFLLLLLLLLLLMLHAEPQSQPEKAFT